MTHLVTLQSDHYITNSEYLRNTDTSWVPDHIVRFKTVVIGDRLNMGTVHMRGILWKTVKYEILQLNASKSIGASLLGPLIGTIHTF